MKNIIQAVLVSAVLMGVSFSQETVSQETINRAVNGIQTLKTMLLDPNSFELDSVEVGATRNEGNFYYSFRAKNVMGGPAGLQGACMNKEGKIRMMSPGFSDPVNDLLVIKCHPVGPFITDEVKKALAGCGKRDAAT